jgi:transposase-like protein
MTDVTNNPILRDDDAAREYLEKLFWPEGVTCPHCGVVRDGIVPVKATSARKKPLKPGQKHRPARKGVYHCNSCSQQFTVTVGTVMESSHIPLRKWVHAFHMMCASKKGASAHQLFREIGVTYKSAWFMEHRIREAMRAGGLAPPMGGQGKIVEADETFIGNLPDVAQAAGGYSHKMAVLTLVERGGGARSFHIPTARASTVMPIIYDNIADERTRVMTDDAGYYGDHIRRYYRHQTVNHAQKEWARGDAHTNTVEGYFSIFKRGMKGVYQHCSEKHLHRYLAEFDFRYSNRSKLGVEDMERMDRALKGSKGKRLKYRTASGPGRSADDAPA